MTEALRVERVSVRLGSFQAVDTVSFEVPQGAWTAIVGPNGAGKTSLLRAIAGVAKYSGNVFIEDNSVVDLSPSQRSKLVSYAPQLPSIQPETTVDTYVTLGRAPYWGRFGQAASTDREIVDDALEQLDLGPMRQRRMSSLSGGERQRAVLAQALVQQAPLLVLDEPTTALDIGHQQQVLSLLDELRHRHGLTVITSLHDLNHAGQYSDQVVALDGGRVKAVGRPEDVFTPQIVSEVFGVTVDVDIDDARRVAMRVRRSEGKRASG